MLVRFSSVWLIVAFTFILAGCEQQSPAKVAVAKPTVKRAAPKHSGKPQVKTAINKTDNTVTTNANKRANKSSTGKKNVVTKAPAEVSWGWPAKGSILTRFSANQTFKGIDIGGNEGTPVVAAGDGEVVYSGNSLRGYGNLIIIKHNKNFLTAYAHNRLNMVKEGDSVILGQRIAEMGQTGTDKVKLHFEVRYQGKPIDPQEVLPQR